MGFLAGRGTYNSSLACSAWPLQLQSQQPSLLFTSPRTKKEKRTIFASLRDESKPKGTICNKRLILFMGFAITPLINLSGKAVEQISSEDQQQKQMFSFVNVIGILGSAALAPLYLSAKKEKEASDAVLESMNVNLNQKQTAIVSLEKKYEFDLSSAKELRKMELAKVNEEKQKLVTQAQQVNEIMSSLDQDVRAEKRIAEELGSLVERLESNVKKVVEEKRELKQQLESKCGSMEVLEERVRLLSSEISDKEGFLQNVGSELAEKERELAELSSSYEEARDEVASLKHDIEELKYANSEKGKEIESKILILSDLNMELYAIQAEIEESQTVFDTLLKEYDDFKAVAETEAASNANLLEERKKIVRDLEDRLTVAVDELDNHRDLVTESTRERDDLAGLLRIELENAKNLEHQLEMTQDSLDKSMAIASDLKKDLQESKNSSLKLEAEAIKIREEYSKARVSLESDIAERKQKVEAIADELRWAKEQVRSSEEELQNLSEELAAAVEKRDSLVKELVNARTAAEKASLDLQKEMKLLSSLKRELRDFQTRFSDEKEAKTTHETHLELATKSLDETNHYISTLSQELQLANSQISSFMDEKEALQKAIEDQTKLSQEAKASLEEAHNAVMRIGKEREILNLRTQKLEDEIAAAKGEILYLWNELNPSTNQQIEDESSSKTPLPARRVARRKKVTTSQIESS